MDRARSLFCSCERSSWQATTMPVGRCVMRTAVAFFCTFCPPAPGGAKDIHANVGFRDLNIDVLHRGEHCDGGGRGVDASGGFGGGDALDTMNARLVLELGKGAAALDLKDHFLEAADADGVFGHDLRLPALAFTKARVHAEQVRREKRRLVTAGARTYLDDHVLFVAGVAVHQQRLDLLLQGLDFGR